MDPFRDVGIDHVHSRLVEPPTVVGVLHEQVHMNLTPQFRLQAVHDITGAEIGRGLANYSSAEARLLCRKPSSEINHLLGYSAEPEMVHRDNMVLKR